MHSLHTSVRLVCAAARHAVFAASLLIVARASAQQPCSPYAFHGPHHFHRVQTGANAVQTIQNWRNSVAMRMGFAAFGTAGPESSLASTSTGQVRLFRRGSTLQNPWADAGSLGSPDGALGDRFGMEISMDGDLLVVGAPLHDAGGIVDAGAAYVYRWSGTAWLLEQKLVASDAAAGDQFAHTVAVSGSRIVIGAWGDNTAAGTNAGSAYVFAWDGSAWLEQGRLLASDAAANDLLSIYASIEGDRIALRTSAQVAGRNGLVYVFRWNGVSWAQEARVTPPSVSVGVGVFMQRVAIRGDWLAVGNPTEASNAGRVHIYQWDGSSWAFDSTQSTFNDGVDIPDTLFGAGLRFDAQDRLVVGGSYGPMLSRLVRNASGQWNLEEYCDEDMGQWDQGYLALQHYGFDVDGDRIMVGYLDGVVQGLSALLIEPRFPYVYRQPLAQAQLEGQQASFSVVAGSVFGWPSTFRWRRDGVELVDGPSLGGGTIIGAETPSLIILNASSADSGQYDCSLADQCNQGLTNSIALTIDQGAPPLCSGDADGNGTVTFADITAVLASLNTTCP